MIDLTGKSALVCGATRGIGRACAEAFARLGARVTLVARDEAALSELARQLNGAGGGGSKPSHDCLVADFRDAAGLREIVTRHVGAFGPIEILVNNTGGPAPGPIIDAKPEEFLAAFSMHVICNHVLAQALVPGMKARGYGRIINIVSTSVRQPIPGLGVSNTVRAAVAGWAKTLAGELAPFGITVNNILPGFTNTDRLHSLIDKTAERAGKPRADVEREMIAGIPAGRFASPEETAAAVAFLASPAAAYITGVSLPVDGGRISAT